MTTRKTVMYAVAGAAIVAVAIGAYEYFGANPQPAPAPAASATKAPPAADEQQTPTSAQADKILGLVSKARQLAADGKFDEAGQALDQADKIVKGQPEVAQARRDIAAMKTPEGQLALQLARAELAIDHGDTVAAERALAEIEKLKPDAPEIAELRGRMQHEQTQDVHRDNRVTKHLTAMREAIARGDFAAADRELNAAERVDVTDPAVHRARIELNRARNAALKKE